ncbi:MAG: ABC transporter substrate-binding protein, partial [Cyclobacteriaceae bacterium]|nr:ABC transporter substrate-binding protein [Cyclobacteriaceae bacterium]
SKQAVSLVYDEEVSLIVAALDGRNAHLAEQVAAKSHVVMLSTQSSDPTLSRAYVPWYFRIVPDDRQQAEVLVEEIYYKEKYTKVALVSLDNYDGKMSVESMVKKSEEKGLLKPEVFIGLEEHELLDKSTKNPWDAIVLSGMSKNISEIISKIKSASRNTKIYAFLNVFNSMENFKPPHVENIWYVSSFEMHDPKWRSFKKAYQSKYGYNPSPSLAFVYDGIMLSIEAIRKFGPDPEEIKISFKSTEFEGITGGIDFDKLGNREMEWRLVEVVD